MLSENIKEKISSSNPGYISGHLSQSITNDDPEFLLNFDNIVCRRHIQIKLKIRKEDVKETIYNSECDPYECCRIFIMSHEVNKTQLKKQYLQIIAAVGESSILYEINFLQNTYQQKEKNNYIRQKYQQVIENLKRNQDLFEECIIIKKAEDIKDKICYSHLERENFFELDGSFFEPCVFILNCPKHKKVIGSMTLSTRDLDILQSNFSLKLFWRLSDMMNCYPDSLYDRGSKILNFFNGKRKIYKEKTFKLLSLWEPFLLGFIVSNKETDIGFQYLFKHTRDKIKELVGNDYEEFEKLLLPKNTTLQEERLMLELLGINKSFGHHCIDATVSFCL